MMESIPEVVGGLPNISGAEAQVEEVTRSRKPVFLNDTNLRLDRLESTFPSPCTCTSRSSPPAAKTFTARR
jgi:hypothetical protein